MKKEEQIQQVWFPAIKGSTRDLIAAAGGIDRISLFLRCSKSLVGNWNNWENSDLMPAWAMIALEADLGRPILSAAYARLTGASVHDPIGAAKRMNTLAMETALLMQEVVEFAGAHAEAFADGEYDVAELRGLRQRLVDIGDQLTLSIATVDRKLAARA